MSAGPAIGGSLDGLHIDTPGECFTRNGERYLWLGILVNGKERCGVWRWECISDSFAIDLLVGGYKAIDGKRSVA